ncbi:MAG: helix-turn-helix transcriptional regulator [Cypionkella sp.]
MPDGDERCLELFLAFSNMLESAVFVLDTNGLLIGHNRIAATLLEEGDGLRLHDGRLTAAALEDTRKFAIAVDTALAKLPDGQREPAMCVFAVRRCGRAALTGTVVPAEQVLGTPSSIAAAFLLASDPEINVDDGIQIVCKLYGLTRTEGQVSRYLVKGFSTGDIALAMDLKEETVRAYLKHIYTKTQVHGQANLVQLLMSSRPGLLLDACQVVIINEAPRVRPVSGRR